MARIFNIIRQRMLKENRFSRYFLYAIGEIVLVVIGILIAVQINDWNEIRKIKLSNDTQLRKMVVELEANIARMELLATNRSGRMSYGFPSLEEAVANCDSLLRLTFIGLSEADIPFVKNARFFGGQSSLNLQQDVFLYDRHALLREAGQFVDARATMTTGTKVPRTPSGDELRAIAEQAAAFLGDRQVRNGLQLALGGNYGLLRHCREMHGHINRLIERIDADIQSHR